MNRSMLFPIHKKWVDMIFNGTKEFEFRNKLPKHIKQGMKIYLYETLGKELKCHCCHEGTGMIVGEFTVKSIRPRYKSWDKVVSIDVPVEEWEHWDDNSTCFGMNEMKAYVSNEFKDYNFAIEITNVIKYDEEWITDKLCESDMPCAKTLELQKYESMLCKVSDNPIPKEEFVKWNSVCGNEKAGIKTNLDWFVKTRTCIVEHAPQAPMYVVEKEV